MRCKQLRKFSLYLMLIVAFASSLMLMGYIHGSTFHRAPTLPSSPKNESNQRSADKRPHENDTIPLIDFKDLGDRKRRLLLLVTVGSAPQRSDRREGIRSTWWEHCKHSQVNNIYILQRMSRVGDWKGANSGLRPCRWRSPQG